MFHFSVFVAFLPVIYLFLFSLHSPLTLRKLRIEGKRTEEQKRGEFSVLYSHNLSSAASTNEARKSKPSGRREAGAQKAERLTCHCFFFHHGLTAGSTFSGERYRQICRLTSQGYQEPKIKPDKLIPSALVIAQKRPVIVLTAFHPKLSVHAADKEWASPLFYCSPKPPIEPAFGLKWLHFWVEKDVPFATHTLVTTEFWWSWKSVPGCCCVVW